jgi:sarcosine oxidase gamma subunit
MSSITVNGSIERKGFGPGTWALVSEGGETYELRNAPAELRQSGRKVQVTGVVRDDVMTMAMIGPVLEVESFDAVSD